MKTARIMLRTALACLITTMPTFTASADFVDTILTYRKTLITLGLAAAGTAGYVIGFVVGENRKKEKSAVAKLKEAAEHKKDALVTHATVYVLKKAAHTGADHLKDNVKEKLSDIKDGVAGYAHDLSDYAHDIKESVKKRGEHIADAARDTAHHIKTGWQKHVTQPKRIVVKTRK